MWARQQDLLPCLRATIIKGTFDPIFGTWKVNPKCRANIPLWESLVSPLDQRSLHFHSCWVQPPGPTFTAFCPKCEIPLGRQFHSHAPSLFFFGSVSPHQHSFTLLISFECPHTCRQSGPQPPPPPPFLKSFPQLSLSRSWNLWYVGGEIQSDSSLKHRTTWQI